LYLPSRPCLSWWPILGPFHFFRSTVYHSNDNKKNDILMMEMFKLLLMCKVLYAGVLSTK
jgi:hypothetical protein